LLEDGHDLGFGYSVHCYQDGTTVLGEGTEQYLTFLKLSKIKSMSGLHGKYFQESDGIFTFF